MLAEVLSQTARVLSCPREVLSVGVEGGNPRHYIDPVREIADRLRAATSELTTPFAVVDLDAWASNADSMINRAGGLPIRIASKSIRCRAIMDRALGLDGFQGVMAYSLAEAIWLARGGATDVLLAYPTVDRAALATLAADDRLRNTITIMVDCVEHLYLIGTGAVRVCIDVDASLRIGPLHLGVRRSPVRSPAQAHALAAEISRRPHLTLAGLMFYDAQIAGLPDTSPAVRAVKRRSATELQERRAVVLAAVREFGDLELVNGGGTGSLHVTGRDPQLTELAGGSGLYGPTLFDHYRDFTPTPAAYFVSSVVRKPSAQHAVVYSSGYIASGPAGWSRQPLPWSPRGASLLKSEGAGEVQTPLRGPGAAALRVGDQVWFRHAKAGELCERFDRLYLVQGDQIVDEVLTYRGAGMNFG